MMTDEDNKVDSSDSEPEEEIKVDVGKGIEIEQKLELEQRYELKVE